MCRDCGCGEPNRNEQVGQDHSHGHTHEQLHAAMGTDHAHHHDHDHDHDHNGGRAINVERSLVELNDHLAMHNRERFIEEGVTVLNMMSSPGAGKTRLLERTLDDLGGTLQLAVITGDLETENDATRLRGRGATVIPVTTGTMCHLDAHLVGHACDKLNLGGLHVLFIENVGNLVCPASFDLGEQLRVVLMSVTEGEDKPLKYPPMFKMADVVLLTKSDLAEPAGFDRAAAVANIHRVAPQAELIELSARTGVGIERWYEYLIEHTLAKAEAQQMSKG